MIQIFGSFLDVKIYHKSPSQILPVDRHACDRQKEICLLTKITNLTTLKTKLTFANCKMHSHCLFTVGYLGNSYENTEQFDQNSG